MSDRTRNKGRIDPYSSNYGLDYEFVRRYDADMRKYGFISDNTVSDINKMISMMDTDMNFKAISLDALALSADYAESQHEGVYRREGIQPGQPVPESVSAMLYPSPEKSGSEFKNQSDGMRAEFYEHVRHCDCILTDKTRRLLGKKYRDYAESQSRGRCTGIDLPSVPDCGSGFSL